MSVRAFRKVIDSLLPGSHIATGEKERGKTTIRAGRLYVTEDVMHAYPEFSSSLDAPGKDIPIEIGPYELVIWTRKPKARKKAKELTILLVNLRQEQLEEQKRLQEQTQAMLNHLLEPVSQQQKSASQSGQRRPPKKSPKHKRMRVTPKPQHVEEMNVEPEGKNDVKRNLDFLDPKSVEAFEDDGDRLRR